MIIKRFQFLFWQNRHIDIRKQLRSIFVTNYTTEVSDEETTFIENDNDYQTLVDKYLKTSVDYKCFVIHPYVKWGPKKIKTSSPQSQLVEAISLINSLQTWEVIGKVMVPLDNLDKKVLFGKGTLEKLTHMIRKNESITSVFINMSTLRNVQFEELEKRFGKPIFDRYSIVMQIFRLHAISKHAKLQIALAEIPFLQNRIKRQDTDFVVSSTIDTRNLMLQSREKKIKDAIKKLQSQRELLRRKRRNADFPVVAVVGYTNVGKTSLIKALTGDKNLLPKDQLFATLDVTFHAGLLPSTLKILYIDTVGFLSDIPTGLIECFNATLEDAILADIILHVEDLSSEDFLHQRIHVLNTLESLCGKIDASDLKNKIIPVGNKCDARNQVNQSLLEVSAKTATGLDTLTQKLEEKVLEITNRHLITLSVPTGGEEIRWLYKNATVVETKENEENVEKNIVKIIITEAKLKQFKFKFVN